MKEYYSNEYNYGQQFMNQSMYVDKNLIIEFIVN